MTLDEARRHVGHHVVYRAPHGLIQDGVITSVNDAYVFVRYGTDADGTATDPARLELLGTGGTGNADARPRADAAALRPWFAPEPGGLDLDAVLERAGEDRVLEDIHALVAEVRRLAADLAVERSGAAVGARTRADLHAEIDGLRAERAAVRALHAPQFVGRVKSGNAQVRIYDCHACSAPDADGSADWPCATAEAVYTAEEIAAALRPEEAPG